jgi:hypothetical protein
MLTEPGPESVKVGTKMPRFRVVVSVCVLDAPVMVNVYCPVAAELVAVKVSVLP